MGDLICEKPGWSCGGVQMQHRDPKSQREMPPSRAAGAAGQILLLVPCSTARLVSALWVWVAVALQLALLLLSAAGTVSVCLSIPGFSLQQDSTGTGEGGRSPGGCGRLVSRQPGRVAGVCCPEWPSSHQSRTAACVWGASAAGACCGRP